MNKLIAIIKINDNSYYNDYSHIIQSITDWSEVTYEDYQLLKTYCDQRSYTIIERIDVDQSALIKTVEQAKLLAKREAEEKQKQKELEEQKKQARLLKKKAKTEAEEKKLLEQLQQKYLLSDAKV